MKNLVIVIVLLITSPSIAQEEIKIPELDTEKKVYILKFGPDPRDERVISAYMKGTTEIDSLRFWAEGTLTTQKVMVTVISQNKDADIRVDIVKNHWEDSKIGGYTMQGVFQESFDTANKFGIVISSDTPNLPYYLAVWTSGEIVPNMGNLYYSANEGNSPAQASVVNTNLITEDPIGENSGSNIMFYIVIGFLVIIAVLLAFLAFKKKKNITPLLLLFFGLALHSANAGGIIGSSGGFSSFMGGISPPSNFADLVKFAQSVAAGSNALRNYLETPADADAEPQVDHDGGPRLPSSCLPPRFGTSTATRNSSGVSGNSSSSSDPSKAPTLDRANSNDGNNTSSGSENNAGSDNDEKVNENYQEALRKANEDYQNAVQEANRELQKGLQKAGDTYSEAMAGASTEYTNAMAQAGGDPEKIEIATKDNVGRINEINSTLASKQSQLQTTFANRRSQLGMELQNRIARLAAEKAGRSQSIRNDGEFNDPEKDEGRNDKKRNNDGDESKGVGSGSEFGSGSGLGSGTKLGGSNGSSSAGTARNSANKEGCDCLEAAYEGLNSKRMNLERLRIIYKNAMTKINWGISFGDNVSGVHAVSGLVWQKQKAIIMTESIPNLNKAYDDKYREMIITLEENLRQIEICETMLGYENWYNHAGFIYYQFMADKYKRN